MSETITIDVDGEVELPLKQILAGRGFITGKSGSGKSTTASVIVEEVLDRGRPVLIVDTDGEYWGLKEEYQILHVGAGGDVDHEVGPEHAEWLAEKALEDGIPVILDVSGYIDQDEVDQIIHDVCHHLFVKEDEAQLPFLVVVEEIHEYVAQAGSLGDVGEMLVRVAKRGRKRGLGICGISQRPANVDKDFISQADWVFWHRLTWSNDTKVVRDVIGAETAEKIDDLEPGEAFLTADFLDDRVLRMRIREKRTFDAAETPDLDGFERPELKGIGEDLSEELEEISHRQQQRQDEIDRLHNVIERKEAEIAELEQELEKAEISTETAERIATAMTGGSDEDVQAQIEEIREEKNAQIQSLKEERDQVIEQREELLDERARLESRIDELEEKAAIDANIDELEEAVLRISDALGLDSGAGDEQLRERLREREQRVDELERKLERAREGEDVELGEVEDYINFAEHDVVQQAVADAKDESHASAGVVAQLMGSIVEEGGPVSYDEVRDVLGHSGTQHVSSAASTLEAMGVVTKEKRDGDTYVDFNIEGVKEIIRKKKERERKREAAQRFQ